MSHAINAGRFQVIPGEIQSILDVAHNPHGARALAEALRHQPCQGSTGKTHAVTGMLADKDIAGVVKEMLPVVDVWHLAGLTVERGASSAQLLEALQSIGPDTENTEYHQYPDVVTAWRAAHRNAQKDDRVVAFGSFHTVAELLQHQQ